MRIAIFKFPGSKPRPPVAIAWTEKNPNHALSRFTLLGLYREWKEEFPEEASDSDAEDKFLGWLVSEKGYSPVTIQEDFDMQEYLGDTEVSSDE